MKRNFLQKAIHNFWFGILIIRHYKTWLLGFLDYFKFLKNKLIIHQLRNGAKYSVRTNSSDFGIINEIYIVKEYHRLLNYINPDSTIIDIGAQIGVFSVFAAKIANKGKVFSFEPFEKNNLLLQKNVKLNDLKNVVISKNAIARKSGSRQLTISKENSGGHSLFQEGDEKVKIETVTLKEVFDKNNIASCDFLKIDCEGAEYEILYNTPREYLDKIKSITLEYHKNGDPKELKGFLEKANFEVEIDKVAELIYAWK
ncbi:MAG: FkbM family methyltransferase [Nanoarchaeota archaeon]|nr:FkbM family methyltransferase [Nanoarchaeota archaeon]